MVVKTARNNATKAYFTLVQEYPLKPIRDDADRTAAQQRLDHLVQQDLDQGGQDYLAVLTSLLENYEDEHVKLSDVTDAEVLSELLRASGLSQAKLAKEVGIMQSTLSELANGKRPFTAGHVAALSRFFHVSPAAFFPAV